MFRTYFVLKDGIWIRTYLWGFFMQYYCLMYDLIWIGIIFVM